MARRSFNDFMQKRAPLANSAVMSGADVRVAFMKRVFSLVGFAAFACAAGAIWPFFVNPKLFPAFMIAGFVGYIGTWITFTWGRNIRRNATPATIMLGIFGLSTGFITAPLLMIALKYFGVAEGSKIIALAGGMTLLTVVSLSGYVLVTKKDFSYLGGAIAMISIGLIVAIIAGWFIHAPMLHILISIGFVIFACLLLLYETTAIMKYYPIDEPYYAAFQFYWTMWILFISLLRIIMYIASSRD